jgi:outer membrane protein OmpA-like peptidoglycan-associated protein
VRIWVTWAVPATIVALGMPAAAEPTHRFELGAFLGVDYFGDDIGLGGSPAPEQRPQSAPTFGGRLTYLPLSLGVLHLGVEGEASFTPSWTGYGFDGPRPSYFAPVVGYRAQLLFRLFDGWFEPHVTVGGGGATVLSGSPYMAKETAPLFQWGVGAAFQVGPRWQLRLDARQGFIEGRMDDTARTYEAFASITARLGVRPAIVHAPVEEPPVEIRPVEPVVVEPPPPPPPKDSDGDGLVDPDDKCADQAEDKDGFEDTDGCPDLDNDNDNIADAKDKCPNEAETANGITDDDGCPDAIPTEITDAFAEAKKITFARDRVPLSSAAKKLLDKAASVALTYKALKITVTVHPDAATDKATEIANKRLAVVKFYLTGQGVATNNLTTVVGAPVTDKKAPVVELTVTTPGS